MNWFVEDTSKDTPWGIDDFSFKDVYVYVTSAIVQIPKILMIPLVSVALLPNLLLSKVLSKTLSKDPIPRNPLYTGISVLLSIPLIVITCFSLCYDYFFYYLFSGIYWIFSGCKVTQYKRSRLVIDQFVHSNVLNEDIYYTLVSKVHRQGVLECCLKFTSMILFIPFIKYYVIANPFISELGIRFITQSTEPIQNRSPDEVYEHFKSCVSDAKPNNLKETDLLSFSPHYPYPPENTDTCMGVQNSSVMCLLVNTTHYKKDDIPLSNSYSFPVYKVMLYYNNPFHLYTGHVEANVSDTNGIEHPMWLVSGHNYASAKGRISTQYIDDFFHNFAIEFGKFLEN